MIKKITSILLMIIISLYIGLNINAAEEFTENLDLSSQYNEWELKENTGVFYLESNRLYNKSGNMSIEVNTSFTMSGLIENPYYAMDNVFVPGSGVETSRINVYSSLTTSTINSTFNLIYEAPEATEVMYLSNGDAENPSWDADFIENSYVSVVLVLSESLTSQARNDILDSFNLGGYFHNSTLHDNSPFNSIYTLATTVYLDPTSPGDLDLLPTTTGSIFDDTNQMATVSVDVMSNNETYFMISYDARYQLKYIFSANTDMSIFNDAYEAFYYTHEGERFMLFNHGTESMFKTTNWKTQKFIPYTIWNLDTNEMVTHDQVNVYIHMTVGDANHIVGYFYVDDFVIDRLIQVSTVFNYRWDPLVGSKSKYMPQLVVLDDTTVLNPTVAWQLSAAAASVSATVVMGGVLSATGVGASIGVPLMLVGTAVSAYLTYVAVDYEGALISGSTTEIEPANPSTDLLTEINTNYKEVNPNFTSIDTSTFPLWKLDFGAYNKFGNTPEVDDETVQIITLSYMTDGEVYVLEADQINTLASVDQYLDPDNNSTPFNPQGVNPSNPNNILYWVIGILGGVLLFKEFKLDKKPGLMILLLAAAAYLLYYLGVF